MNKEIVRYIKKNGTDLNGIKAFLIELTAHPNINDTNVYENLLNACFEFLQPSMLKFMFSELGHEYKYWHYTREIEPVLTKNLISQVMASYLMAHVLAEQIIIVDK